MKINVLGTEYIVIYRKKDEDECFKSDDCLMGYCDDTVKEIVILVPEDNPANVKDIESFKREIIRHEIIHAFLSESGLKHSSVWAKNEEIIDYFAIQMPKMFELFKNNNLLD